MKLQGQEGGKANGGASDLDTHFVIFFNGNKTKPPFYDSVCVYRE